MPFTKFHEKMCSHSIWLRFLPNVQISVFFGGYLVAIRQPNEKFRYLVISTQGMFPPTIYIGQMKRPDGNLALVGYRLRSIVVVGQEDSDYWLPMVSRAAIGCEFWFFILLIFRVHQEFDGEIDP